VYEILVASGRLSDVLVNPQQFIDGALIRLNRVLNELIVDGIRYEKIGGEEYEMQLFESQEIEAYLDHLYKVKNQEKTIADYIVWDSEVERDFAVELENYEKVKFFMKLPNWFNIETPLGKYNPDWAIVFEGENKLYFVAETKGREELQDLAYSEKQKIICGQKHFEQIDNVEFVAPVKDLKSFIEQSGVR
jgi:type III restriction enzyme